MYTIILPILKLYYDVSIEDLRAKQFRDALIWDMDAFGFLHLAMEHWMSNIYYAG